MCGHRVLAVAGHIPCITPPRVFRFSVPCSTNPMDLFAAIAHDPASIPDEVSTIEGLNILGY